MNTSEFIQIRGKTIYIERHGSEQSPALLYIHGGPGSGSYDFTLCQGDRLSQDLYLITMDQRGVLRSDPLHDEEFFGIQDLVEDCEALRDHLGVKKWSVLSHSFGGYIALLYAIKYPESIDSLLFECPAFDLDLSSRSLLRGAALEYLKMGDQENSKECLQTAEGSQTPVETWQLFSRLTNALGEKRNNLYVHGPNKDFFEELVSSSPIPEEYWSRSNRFQSRLYAEGEIFHSLLPQFTQIRQPALIMKGDHDWVASEDQVNRFLKDVAGSRLERFANSGHFPRVEEPEHYAEVVIRFIKEQQEA